MCLGRGKILVLLISSFNFVYCDEKKDEELPVFKCQMSEDGSRCDLKNIKITKDQPLFKISVDDSSKITEVYVTESILPVLSKSICNTFVSLKRIHIVDANIKFIRWNAFEKCTNLEEINLAHNKIKTLKPRTFDTNLKLKKLSLDNNLLSELPDNVFDNLGELLFLHLQNNMLKEFKADLLKNCKKLEILYIFTNDLTDLDIESLHSMLPNLQTIYANNNNFPCKRVQQMTIFGEINKIDLSREYHGDRNRGYEPKKIEHFLCKSESTPPKRRPPPPTEPMRMPIPPKEPKRRSLSPKKLKRRLPPPKEL